MSPTPKSKRSKNLQIWLQTLAIGFGIASIGIDFMKEMVCETLSLMSEEIINFVTSKCWFMASIEDAYAFTFTGNDLKDKHLVFLSDDLLVQDKSQIRYTIAHEIGHVILGHRNSVVYKQTRQEIKEQEIEANEFAKNFI